MAAPAAPVQSVPASRIQSVDAPRGAIMMLMAIDHICDYVDRSAQHFSPADLRALLLLYRIISGGLRVFAVAVYAVWVVVLLLLYPVYLWFGRLKLLRHDCWLTYL